MKIFLCGQGPAAETVLRAHLTPAVCENMAVFTHPGSGWAEQLIAWEIWNTCESVNNVDAWPFEPDVIISIYYRTIIKQHVIERCPRIFNAHTSLLPRNRGRSPIPWAIVEGDKHTGVTYHYIDAGIDTGRILLQAACQITEDETQTTLFKKINGLVVDYFPAALALVMAGFKGIEQQGEATYHFAGPPHGGEINPFWAWGKIERFVRAMTYPPLPPARFYGRDIRTMDDYRQALYEKHRDTQSHNNLTLSPERVKLR